MENEGWRYEKRERERLSWRSSKRNRWGAADRTFISPFYKQVGVKDKSCQVRNLIHWSVRYTITTTTTTIGTTSFHFKRVTAKTAAQRTCRAIPLRLTELGLKDDKRVRKGMGEEKGTGCCRTYEELCGYVNMTTIGFATISCSAVLDSVWTTPLGEPQKVPASSLPPTLSVSFIPSLQLSQECADKWNSQINALSFRCSPNLPLPSSVCLQRLLVCGFNWLLTSAVYKYFTSFRSILITYT